MNTHQKRTYLVYSRGLMPSEMTLGSLYLDPANPLDDERKRMDFSSRQAIQYALMKTKPEDIQDYLAPIETEASCVLRFTASSDWLINAGVMDMASLMTGRTGSQEVSISAKSGRRVQLKRPEAFLKEVVLAVPAVADWLSNRLSVSRAVYYASKLKAGKGRHPRIWMLTGIQYLTDVKVTSDKQTSSAVGVSASVPPPEPLAAVVSLLGGQSLANFAVERERGSATSASYHHTDERIWAARFAPLNVNFYPAGKVDEAELRSKIVLGPLPDLKLSGLRGDEQGVAEEELEQIADVTGLDETGREQWDEDASSMLDAMHEVDWRSLDQFLEKRTA